MIVTLAADLHIGVPGRLEDILWALREIISYNKEHNIKYLFILGDLLHDRESINVKDLCALTDVLEEAETNGQKVITFPGNHDMYMKNSWDVTSLKPLNKHLQYFDGVSKLEIGGHNIWILPFIHYEKDYLQTYSEIVAEASPGDYLFTHIGIKNALYNSCFLLKSWSEIDMKTNPFTKVFTGHFHNYQQIGNNIFYVGSLIPFKFDEGDVDHGFITLDLESGDHKLISIWNNKSSADRPPQFLTLDDDLIFTKTKEEISGNIIRIALFKEYTNNEMAEMRTHIEKLGAKTVRFINWASKEDKDVIEITQANAASASELFDRFIEADKKGTEGLTKSLLLKFNKEITAEGDRRYV